MKTKAPLAAILMFAAAVLAVHATPKKPKLTVAQARAIALKRAPGTVKSEELEQEKGALVYSFDIATSKTEITEILVNANSGAIVDVQHETAAKEAAEKRQEAKEKSAKKH